MSGLSLGDEGAGGRQDLVGSELPQGSGGSRCSGGLRTSKSPSGLVVSHVSIMRAFDGRKQAS